MPQQFPQWLLRQEGLSLDRQGFDDVIIALYARGLSIRGFQGDLKELYCADVLPTLIFNVTNCVLEERKARQARRLPAR